MTHQHADLEQAITAKLESLYSNAAFYDDAAAAHAVLELLYERGEIARPECLATCQHGGRCTLLEDHEGQHESWAVGRVDPLLCSWPNGVEQVSA